MLAAECLFALQQLFPLCAVWVLSSPQDPHWYFLFHSEYFFWSIVVTKRDGGPRTMPRVFYWPKAWQMNA